MLNKKIIQVQFYQGVKFGAQVIRYIALDEYHSDKALLRGNHAVMAEGGVGILVNNDRTGELILVPFNNVASVSFAVEKPEAKKAK